MENKNDKQKLQGKGKNTTGVFYDSARFIVAANVTLSNGNPIYDAAGHDFAFYLVGHGLEIIFFLSLNQRGRGLEGGPMLFLCL